MSLRLLELFLILHAVSENIFRMYLELPISICIPLAKSGSILIDPLLRSKWMPPYHQGWITGIAYCLTSLRSWYPNFKSVKIMRLVSSRNDGNTTTFLRSLSICIGCPLSRGSNFKSFCSHTRPWMDLHLCIYVNCWYRTPQCALSDPRK